MHCKHRTLEEKIDDLTLLVQEINHRLEHTKMAVLDDLKAVSDQLSALAATVAQALAAGISPAALQPIVDELSGVVATLQNALNPPTP